MFDWSKTFTLPNFFWEEKKLIFLLFFFFFFWMFSCAGCIWTRMMLHYTVNWELLRMSWLTLRRMSCFWGGWKKKSCKILLFLLESCVSFMPHAVVETISLFFFFFLQGLALIVTFNDHWKWLYMQYNAWDLFSYKDIFANKLLPETSHSALFIPICCQNNGRNSPCSESCKQSINMQRDICIIKCMPFRNTH